LNLDGNRESELDDKAAALLLNMTALRELSLPKRLRAVAFAPQAKTTQHCQNRRDQLRASKLCLMCIMLGVIGR